jgi:hypothetical protein
VALLRPERVALALLLLATATASGAMELGTLFHSPAERADLEKLRRGQAGQALATGPVAPRPEVTGFVRRSDGRHTVWIDGVPVTVAGTRADPLTQRGDAGRAVGVEPDSTRGVKP